MANLEVEDDHSGGYARPLLVTIISVLSMLAGILLILGGVLSLGIFTTLSESRLVGILPLGSFAMLSYVFVAAGISTSLQGWGLLKMKPWAWIMATFLLLTMAFLSVHTYVSNAAATKFELSIMIAGVLIAGLLLAYFVKKRKYFDLDMLSTRTTLIIIGGLVTYSILWMAMIDMAGTTMQEWYKGLLAKQGLHSI